MLHQGADELRYPGAGVAVSVLLLHPLHPSLLWVLALCHPGVSHPQGTRGFPLPPPLTPAVSWEPLPAHLSVDFFL